MALEVIDAMRIQALLPMQECIDVMAQAMVAASRAQVLVPPRMILPVDDTGALFAVMPAIATEHGVFGAKVLSVTPANAQAGQPIIQGQFLLFEQAGGDAVAILDAAALTAIRTAAASGLATRLLARTEARSCGIFGTGVQAATHLKAMCTVRQIDEIRVWGRSFKKTASWAKEQTSIAGTSVTAYPEPEAVAACDIVCTVTASPAPILAGAWVRPGTHVNLVGAHSLATRESDSALIAHAEVYVDLMESARNEAGDLMIPIQEGVVPSDHVRGEIGQVLTAAVPGRSTKSAITVHKSLGIAAQDLFAAWHVFRKVKG